MCGGGVTLGQSWVWVILTRLRIVALGLDWTGLGWAHPQRGRSMFGGDLVFIINYSQYREGAMVLGVPY